MADTSACSLTRLAVIPLVPGCKSNKKALASVILTLPSRLILAALSTCPIYIWCAVPSMAFTRWHSLSGHGRCVVLRSLTDTWTRQHTIEALLMALAILSVTRVAVVCTSHIFWSISFESVTNGKTSCAVARKRVSWRCAQCVGHRAKPRVALLST